MVESPRLNDAGQGTSTAHTDDNGPTDGQRAGRKRRSGECDDDSEQGRSRTGAEWGALKYQLQLEHEPTMARTSLASELEGRSGVDNRHSYFENPLSSLV